LNHRVYLDNHATTPMDPRVLEAMLPYFTEKFGNPGSVGHSFGDEARAAVDAARQQVAKSVGVTANEVVFTSGATESNNLALRGVAERCRNSTGHFISVTTEHKAVIDPLRLIEKRGLQVTFLSPLQTDHSLAGWLDPEAVAAAITPDTVLASVMLVNNEIGVVQPIREIAQVCHERNVLLHCDATQAVGRMAVDLADLDVDLVSFSGHKIYGPKGVGVLIVRRRRPRIRLSPLLAGGGQEHGLRSGTLNVPGIVGLAKALELCDLERDDETKRISDLQSRLYQQLQELPGVELNGPELSQRIPGNLNVRFDGVDGEALMMNMQGIAVSSGSACTSADPQPSHVLRALGLTEDQTRSSLRFGIGRFNSAEDIDLAAATLKKVVTRLRSLGSS
jgi:cysteine desulfurase